MAHVALQLKERGNAHFKREEWAAAEALYSQAIQKDSRNPLLYTNRANARMKMKNWQAVIDDCLKSLEYLQDNMKAFHFLAQAQLAINHPNEALSSALMAYELCVKTAKQTSNAATICALVMKCKRAKWELRERERLRRRNELLGELEDKLQIDRKRELSEIEEKMATGEMGEIEGKEERVAMEELAQKKIDDLRQAFAISDPANLTTREVPEYLIDPISFEIMHDRKLTPLLS